MPTQTAVFAGGCFWCTEATMQNLKGVSKAVPGYTGGNVPNPSYQRVTTGSTGHAEAVQVTFDPNVISYKDLLNVFFATHDPTTLNRQGNDIGTQYRSAIFYADEQQKKEATEFIEELNKDLRGKIVTEVTALDEFYEAEDYHHDYFKKNPTAGYCQVIISPKMAKMRKEFAHLLQS
jgi:peptide-methionine (S)-S-oxide reductase